MIKELNTTKLLEHPLDALSPQMKQFTKGILLLLEKQPTQRIFGEGWKAVEAQLAEISDPKVRHRS